MPRPLILTALTFVVLLLAISAGLASMELAMGAPSLPAGTSLLWPR